MTLNDSGWRSFPDFLASPFPDDASDWAYIRLLLEDSER
jgi:hypothetical protein